MRLRLDPEEAHFRPPFCPKGKSSPSPAELDELDRERIRTRQLARQREHCLSYAF